MQGTQCAHFSAEVLQRGAAVVLPPYLPDRCLDALLEEADLLAPGEGDPEEGDCVHECCAGLLGAVLVVLMAQRGHPDQLEVAVSMLMRHLHCSILALAAERVSRDTDIWVEPPREHGDAGDYAASGTSSTSMSGYQRLNTVPSSWFRVLTRVCSRRCAPRLLHCICCFLQNRLLTT